MPIIGIITRKSKSDEGHNIDIIYDAIKKAILKNGGYAIGIIPDYNYKVIIDLCDGIILQGGDEKEEYDFDIVNYLYNNDIPTLGICLGMQIMGTFFNGNIEDIGGHKTKLSYAHSVKIDKESLLFKILKKEIINVNSRHNSVLKNTSLNIVGVSNDNKIEAIESNKKRFFIGIQWHPENMIDYDQIQNDIFRYFINVCKSR